ncbi:helix-turn-helix domain-containing protein [Blastomonas aquatica]|uniref:HTH marR-type domain-containing protein n=1 Tax=Blastomonas aquatica TaxID=1510276 RepID=A0ABQ1IYX4_9SPHN|nr:hypothetical protein [Blastomonas aquatica]GGB56026.1 hypothetical protein GCM10010833_08420 [Blastomonas aquatica]
MTDAGRGLMFRDKQATPAARLSQISNELLMLASDLERTGPPEPCAIQWPDVTDMRRALKRYLRMRRDREKLFPKLFGDPAWDMLLVLYVYHSAGIPMQVSAIAGLANIPGTTSLRYLDLLIEQKLITRAPDPKDRRRIWLVITPRATALLKQWFSALPLMPE